jgi:hypothetical protein
MRWLSIAAAGLAALLGACAQRAGPAWTPIARPSPDDPTPLGIAYICEGRKEVSVVYAKNRASVTFDSKTWRMEYRPTGEQGFRYSDSAHEWAGRDDLASLRNNGVAQPVAFNCRPVRRMS